MQLATRVRLAAACCVALGVVGAGALLARDGFSRPALLIACLAVVLVGVLLSRRADAAASRRPGW